MSLMKVSNVSRVLDLVFMQKTHVYLEKSSTIVKKYL